MGLTVAIIIVTFNAGRWNLTSPSATCQDDVASKVRYIHDLILFRLTPPNGLMHLNSGTCTGVYVCMYVGDDATLGTV